MQQQQPLTLRRNFSWTFVGNLVYAGSQWGMLVVLAKLGSPEMVGQFTLGFAVTAPVMIFSNLALRQVQATDTKHEYLFSDYLGLRLITTAFALIFITGITLIAGYRLQASLIILVVGLAKALESISDLFYGLLQHHEQMDRIAISQISRGILSLFLLGLGVYLTGSILWGAIGLMIAWVIVLASYDIRSGALILNKALLLVPEGKVSKNLATALQPRWEMGTLRSLLWLTLPLGLATMLNSLNTNIPRYFIERYLGERDLGIFAAISYLLLSGSTVVSALGQSASPQLAKLYSAGNWKAFRKLLLKLATIGALLGGTGVLIALLAGQQLLAIFYKPEYAEYVDVFVWLMVAAAVNYVGSFAGYGMTASHYFKLQPIIYATSAVLTTIVSFLLIPKYGLLGAAWEILIVSFAVMTVLILCNVYAIQKLRKIKLQSLQN